MDRLTLSQRPRRAIASAFLVAILVAVALFSAWLLVAASAPDTCFWVAGIGGCLAR